MTGLRWNWQSERYLTLKVGNCNYKDANQATHELDIERHIRDRVSRHDGRNYVRTFVEKFEEKGPHGTHICLGYEPMREPLWLFQTRLRNQRFPLSLLKGYIKLLLKGLDYLHSECNVIHTGKLSLHLYDKLSAGLRHIKISRLKISWWDLKSLQCWKTSLACKRPIQCLANREMIGLSISLIMTLVSSDPITFSPR